MEGSRHIFVIRLNLVIKIPKMKKIIENLNPTKSLIIIKQLSIHPKNKPNWKLP